jgi:hypothetical protein
MGWTVCVQHKVNLCDSYLLTCHAVEHDKHDESAFSCLTQ